MKFPSKPRPSLLQCCKQGVFFCQHCQRVAQIGDNGSPKCPHGCKVYNLKWMPPVL